MTSSDHPLNKILAHTQAVRTRQREALEEAERLTAVPGRRVRVIRWPWPVGAEGIVIGVWCNGSKRKATVDLGERILAIPLDALTTDMTTDISSALPSDCRPWRRVQESTRGVVPSTSLPVIDCAQADVAASAARIKYSSGEFLE